MAGRLRRFAWIAGGGGLLAVTSVIAALVVRPEWFLTPPLASWAARHFLVSYAPTWSRLSVTLTSKTLFEKQFSISAEDFCFHDTAGKTAGCFNRLEFVVGIKLSRHGVDVVRLEDLLARGERLSIDLRGPTAAVAADQNTRLPVDPRQLLPAPFRRMTLGPLDVDLPGTEIVQASATLKGDFALTFQPERKHPLLLRADFKRTSGGRTSRYVASADLDSHFFKGNGSGYLDGQARLSAGPKTAARLQAHVERESGGKARLGFTVSARDGPSSLQASGRASMAGERLEATAAIDVSLATGPFKTVALKPITVVALLQKDLDGLESLTLKAPFQVQAREFDVQGIREAPLRLAGQALFDAQAAPSPDRSDGFKANLEIAVAPVGDWYTVEGTLTAALSGRLDALDQTVVTKQGADIVVKISRFADLVQHLSGTPWAIPAPLDALKGSLSLEAHSPVQSLNAPLRLRYEFKSDLSGERQKLRAKATGGAEIRNALAPDRSIKISADADLEDVALQLPRLNVTALPAVAPDSRIHPHRAPAAAGLAGSEPAAPGLDLTLDLRVRTSSAAILYTNLAQSPVPVDLDATLISTPTVIAGTITFKTFRVRLFRRDAVVDHIRLTRLGKAKPMGLDGLVVYKTPDAVIYIHLLGDTDKPQVALDSKPAMSRSDILSLLIFGEMPDELDPDQQTSLSNSNSAVSQDAFGLASLYLFASTPIQFVGYDPISRGYTVQFRLPGHSSLSLGSNATETERVTLRKRLSAHWAVETEAGHYDLQGNVVTTVLEWFDRY